MQHSDDDPLFQERRRGFERGITVLRKTLRALARQILATRGYDMSPSAIQEVERCRDIDALYCLCVMASTTTAPDDLFDKDEPEPLTPPDQG